MFSLATLGMYVGMVTWSFTFFATTTVADYPEKFSQDAMNLLLLLPNTCMLFGMRTINEFEKDGKIKSLSILLNNWHFLQYLSKCGVSIILKILFSYLLIYVIVSNLS